MKKSLLILICLFIANKVFSQAWEQTLNNIIGSPDFGTSSNHPINFYTNGTLRMSLSQTGDLRINNLAGSGSRFLQVDASGTLGEWTGNFANSQKILFGDGNWIDYPFYFNSGIVTLANGATKLGIGVSSPSAAVDVNGDIYSNGIIKSQNGFLFNSTDGFTFDPINGSFFIGKIGSGFPAINSCLLLPNIAGSVYNGQGGFITGQDYTATGSNAATNVKSTLRMFVLPANGSGYLDLDGKSNTGFDDNQLYVNYYCGRNTAINTGSNGGIVYIGTGSSTAKLIAGEFVSMKKHLEIGDPITGINNATGNTALDINVNSGNGLRFKTTNSTIPLISALLNSNNVFSLFGDGKTEINTSNVDAIIIKDGNLFNNTVLKVHSSGTIDFITAAADAINVIDASTNLSNFKLHSNGNMEFSPATANAITIKNGNGGSTTFNINKSGFTEITTSSTKALAIYNANNSNVETFSIKPNGYTEINVHSPLGMPVPTGATNARVFTIRDMNATPNSDLFAITANGKVYAREVEINLLTVFPDYVFDKDYDLISLKELEEYISLNKHLPGFEKGEYYNKNGINLNEMILKQQEKIEELTLYIIKLEKKFELSNK